MTDMSDYRRRQPDEVLHQTARDIQAEIIDTADRLLVRRLRARRTETFSALWPTRWGGERRLYGVIAAALIKRGAQANSTTRQLTIAEGLMGLGRRRQARAVKFALRGDSGIKSEVPPITDAPYPIISGTRLEITDDRPYIQVSTKRQIGGVAAAVLVRTNPRHREAPVDTAEYPTFEAWLEAHPGFVQPPQQYEVATPPPAAPAEYPPTPVVAEGPDYELATRVLRNLFPPEEVRQIGAPPAVNELDSDIGDLSQP